MLPQLMLCSFGPHEPIHASGIGLLLEVPGVLMSIEHLHHGEHCTHSGTRTVCPLIPISDQHIAVPLCPNYFGWIHPRKSTSGTTGKLIPVLLTNLTQHLKSHYLGNLPRSSSFRFCPPFLPKGCLVTSWYGQLYFIPWLSLQVYFIPVIEGRFVIPRIVQDSPKQGRSSKHQQKTLTSSRCCHLTNNMCNFHETKS